MGLWESRLVIESTAQLRELATEIQDHYSLCEQAWRTTVEHAQAMMEHARAIGEKLLAAKKLAGHGHWESWVKSNLPFSIDKAERMMRLHKNWDRIKSAREPILGIKEAIVYLAAPKRQDKQDKPVVGDGDGGEKEAGTGRAAAHSGAAPHADARKRSELPAATAAAPSSTRTAIV